MSKLALNDGRRSSVEIVAAKGKSLEVVAIFFGKTHDKAKAKAQQYLDLMRAPQAQVKVNRMTWIALIVEQLIVIGTLLITFLAGKGG